MMAFVWTMTILAVMCIIGYFIPPQSTRPGELVVWTVIACWGVALIVRGGS